MGIKSFFDWKAKIDRKTFLIRFFDCLLLSFLLVFIPLVPLICALILLYMVLCVLYQYIQTVSPKRTLATYFVWIILYFILTQYVFPGAVSLYLWHYVPGMSIFALFMPPFIFIIPILIMIIVMLSAWLLSTQIALSFIRKIVDFLAIIWEKVRFKK